MRRKLSFRALAVLMAILTAVVTPLQAIAAAKKVYISEIRMGYGEDGKQALTDAGYTVWEDLDANEGGTGSAVYLGYKTTTVKEDAITDIALMPMGTDGDRAYSFEAYANEMKALSNQIDDLLEKFDAAIEEFRENYNKPAPYNDYAVRAYQILNMYIEDDTGLGLGDLFVRDVLDETDTKENGASTGTKLKNVYHNVLMMGNSTAVAAIKNALAMGCTETNGETFLDRLSKAEYTGEIEESKNDYVQTVSNVISDFQEELSVAKAIYAEADAYEGGREKYINNAVEQELDVTAIIAQITLIDVMTATPYGNVTDENGNSLSLYDVMMLPTSFSNENQLVLTTQLLFLLVDCMTPGQIAMSEYTGLASLIRNAYSTTLEKEKDDDGVEHFSLSAADYYLEQLKQLDALSVYTGVDRSVFSDYTNVAITDAAIRSMTLNNGLGIASDYNTSSYNAAKIGLFIASGITFATGLSMTIAAASKWGKSIVDFSETVLGCGKTLTTSFALQNSVGQAATYSFSTNNFVTVEDTLNELTAMWEANDTILVDADYNIDNNFIIGDRQPIFGTSLGTKITAVAGAIFMVASIALAVIGFVMSLKSVEPQKITYTLMPRAIIDIKRKTNGDDLYFVYYASKAVNTTKEFDDYSDKLSADIAASLTQYGDINGLNTYEQWVGLYYAKDLRLGSPLTTNILVKNASTLTALQKKKYVPVHDFFNNTLVANNTDYTAFDLNQTSQKENHPSIYAFFQRDTSVAPLTSTIMDETASFNWVSIVTFFVGAGLAAGATGLVMKRKSRKHETAQA